MLIRPAIKHIKCHAGLDPASRPILDSRFRDCVAMFFLSLRTTEGSVAIFVLSEAYKIASVVSLLRNDIAAHFLRGNDDFDTYCCRSNH